VNSPVAELRERAIELGASDAKVIPASMIPIQDEVLEMCRAPRCDGYGLSANCPPHSMTPADTRALVIQYEWAVLFKVDVAPDLLLSKDRFKAFKRIFEMAAQLEAQAVKMGYSRARGFAAGSCKPVFCREVECRVLAQGEECRVPTLARSSMEAVGINVFELVRQVGWEIHKLLRKSDPDSVPSGMLAGLILVG
jgi:predicted metal-binding protein